MKGDENIISPDLLKLLVSKFATELRYIFSKCFTNDVQKITEAIQQIKNICQQLEQSGIKVDSQKLATLPQLLQIWYTTSPDKTIFQQIIKISEELEEELKQENGKPVDQIFQELSIKIQTIFATPPPPNYQEIAQKSIHEATQGGPPRFNFNQLWNDFENKKNKPN